MSAATDVGALGQGVEMLVKMDEVLEALREHGKLTVAQIARTVGEPRSSVYRLIGALEEMELVETAEDGAGHRLGLRLFALGQLVASRLPIVAEARPALERLFEQVGETVFLMVRDGERAICLDRVDGRRVQSLAVLVGGTLPLHLGAGPAVLLAHAEPDFVDRYLEQPELTRLTERSIVEPGAVRDRLREIRERGYAVSDEDLVSGIAGIAAPVRDETGAVRASISLSGARAGVLGRDADAVASLVLEAAASVAAPAA